MNTDLQWWGYLHTNGSIQAKRYFGPEDISEANASPFVQSVCGPFDAKSRDEAIEIITNRLVRQATPLS